MANLLGLGLGLALLTAAPDDGTAARTALERLASTYGQMDFYSDEGILERVYVVDGERIERAEPYRLRFARPDRLELRTPTARFVSDGETLLTIVQPAGYVERRSAPDAIGVDHVDVSAVGSVLKGDPLGPPLLLVLGLLTGEEPERSIADRERLELEPEREWEGRTVQVVRISQIGRPDWRLFLDPETSRLLGGEAVLDPEAIEALSPPGRSLEALEVRWTTGAISTEEPPETAFATEPPPGLADVGTLLRPQAEREAQGERPDDPRIGETAPEFTVTLLEDGAPGESIRKLDLEGRVVVIDFWATWCGPCLKELPELADLIDRYDDGDEESGPRFLFVSVDQPEGDLERLAGDLQSFLKERELMNIDRAPIARVGIDPEGAIARAFRVSAIPTALLIDQQGVIQDVFVGYDPAVRRKLAERIDALLAEAEAESDPDPDPNSGDSP